MSRIIKTLLISGLTAGAITATLAAIASAQVSSAVFDSKDLGTEKLSDPEPLDQVTSVSQLSDVKPTDWAFQALQSLVERYGCIVGYPDKTYRGNRALSRYEFAAGLNACMNRLSELLASSTADLVRKEDLATVQKLQEQFAAELASLRGRVDALEVRTATLEKQQFSTTTRLNAEAVVALAGVATGDDILGRRASRNTVLGDRIRLNFDTSFTGRDLLRTRLQAGNLNLFSPVIGTQEGSLRFNADSGNSVGIDALLYQFPIGERTRITIEANAGATDDFADTFNPFFDGDGGSGALTNFATRNPIYYYADGVGIGIRHEFSQQFELSLGYLAGDAANPNSGNGLFNGRYGALAQVAIKPSDRFKFGFTYVHSYNNESGTGSPLANPRSLLRNTFDQFAPQTVVIPPGILPGFPGATTTVGDVLAAVGFKPVIPVLNDSFGFQFSWQVSDYFVVNSWVGYTRTRNLSTGGGFFSRGTLESLNWAVALGFPNVGRKGALAGIVVGMEPKVLTSSIGINPVLAPLASLIPSSITQTFSANNTDSLHIEAFYQFPINDNIAITPGIIWITDPGFSRNNSDLLMGVIRTTFTF